MELAVSNAAAAGFRPLMDRTLDNLSRMARDTATARCRAGQVALWPVVQETTSFPWADGFNYMAAHFMGTFLGDAGCWEAELVGRSLVELSGSEGIQRRASDDKANDNVVWLGDRVRSCRRAFAMHMAALRSWHDRVRMLATLRADWLEAHQEGGASSSGAVSTSEADAHATSTMLQGMLDDPKVDGGLRAVLWTATTPCERAFGVICRFLQAV